MMEVDSSPVDTKVPASEEGTAAASPNIMQEKVLKVHPVSTHEQVICYT